MDQLPLDVLCHVFSFDIGRIRNIKMVCKVFWSVLRYKVMKFYSVDTLPLECTVKEDLITIDFKRCHDIQGNLYHEFINGMKNMYDLMTMKLHYEDDYNYKNIEESQNKVSTDKNILRGNKEYTLVVHRGATCDDTKVFKFSVPLITTGTKIYDFKYFTLEIRDTIPRENKDIPIYHMSKFIEDREIINQLFYYKISRNTPDSVFEAVMFEKMPRINESKYEDIYNQFYNKGVSIFPCCKNRYNIKQHQHSQ